MLVLSAHGFDGCAGNEGVGVALTINLGVTSLTPKWLWGVYHCSLGKAQKCFMWSLVALTVHGVRPKSSIPSGTPNLAPRLLPQASFPVPEMSALETQN